MTLRPDFEVHLVKENSSRKLMNVVTALSLTSVDDRCPCEITEHRLVKESRDRANGT